MGKMTMRTRISEERWRRLRPMKGKGYKQKTKDKKMYRHNLSLTPVIKLSGSVGCGGLDSPVRKISVSIANPFIFPTAAGARVQRRP